MVKISCRVSASPEGYRFSSSHSESGDYKTGNRSRLGTLMILIFSLLISFAIWAYASSLNTTLVTKQYDKIPVEIVNLDSSLHIYSGDIKTVDVILKGTRTQLNRIDSSQIRAYIDLKDYQAGSQTARVQVTTPEYTEIEYQSIYDVQFIIDKSLTTTVPIKCLINCTIESGTEKAPESAYIYDIDGVVTPAGEATVNVTGPADKLKNISFAVLRSDPGLISKTYSFNGPLTLTDKDNIPVDTTNITFSPESVGVTIPVYVKKTVPLTYSFSKGYFIEGETVNTSVYPQTVEIKGEYDVISRITEISLGEIDETTIGSSDNPTIARKITPPAGVTIVGGTEQAEIRVDYLDNIKRDFTVTKIEYVNRPENMEIKPSQETFNVTLRGRSQYIYNLSPNQVYAEIDLSAEGGTTGDTNVTVNFKVREPNDKYVYYAGSPIIIPATIG